MRVRPIECDQLAGLFPQLAELLEIGENQRDLTLATLEWFFFRNPAGDGLYAGAFEGEKLAGVASIAPKRFRIGGREVLAAEIGRTMTHAAFRGRGIFSRLVEYLIAQAGDRGYAFLYGTPNQASGEIYLGKLGWSSLFRWERSARPLVWADHPMVPSRVRWAAPMVQPLWNLIFPLRSRATDCTVDDTAHADVAGLVDQACAIDRGGGYTEWRFDRPGHSYKHVHCWRGDGILIGWAVAKLVEDEQRRRVHIGDWWTSPDRAALRGLLAGAVDLAQELSATELYVADRRRGTPRVDRSLGFLTRASRMPVIAFPLNHGVEDLQRWDFRDADADMY